MAPLLLLFLLGGLCALFTLASSSSRTAKKCCDGDQAKSHVAEQEKPAKTEQTEKKVRPDSEADLGIVFSTFDHDGDGFITAGELEESLKRLGIAVSAAEAAATTVGEVATIITAAVRDVATVVGGFATEVFEIRESARKAAEEHQDD
jgi:hypothetical protein